MIFQRLGGKYWTTVTNGLNMMVIKCQAKSANLSSLHDTDTLQKVATLFKAIITLVSTLDMGMFVSQ